MFEIVLEINNNDYNSIYYFLYTFLEVRRGRGEEGEGLFYVRDMERYFYIGV